MKIYKSVIGIQNVKTDGNSLSKNIPAVYLSNLHKSWGKSIALDGVSLKISKGEFTTVLGPSGCGKTTLLRVVAGLEKPDRGSIEIEGQDVTQVSAANRGCGVVFQSYALFPNMTVRENIRFGIPRRGRSRSDVRKHVNQWIEIVGLESEADKYPGQLSGGQQQRTALARALAIEPNLLLLDEPLSALDAKVRERLRRELRDLQQRTGITTMMVTHDQEEAMTIADRIVLMRAGTIVQTGTPQEIYDMPCDAFVGDFIGSINMFSDPTCLNQFAYIQKNSKDKQPIVTAIRPEHLLLEDVNSTKKGLPAIIKAIEFRGAFFRYYLKLLNSRRQSDNYSLIAVDIRRNKTLKHHAIGKQVQLIIPPDRLLRLADRLGGNS